MKTVPYPYVVTACLVAYMAIVGAGKYFHPSQDISSLQAAVASSIAPAAGQPTHPTHAASTDTATLDHPTVALTPTPIDDKQHHPGVYGYAVQAMDESTGPLQR